VFSGAALAVVLALAGAGCEQPTSTTDGGVDANRPDMAFVIPDGSTPCMTDMDCDDHIACTRDSCQPAHICGHTLDHGACDDHVFCNGIERYDTVMGCVHTDRQTCDDSDVCTLDRCDEASKMCQHAPRDLDQDGDPDQFCAMGHDCDDRDPTRSSLQPELCMDMVDNDCDGLVDESMCGRPAHDTCMDPLHITMSGSYDIMLSGAGADYTLGCVGAARPDIVASITLTEPHDLTLTAEGDLTTTVIALRTTCDDRMTESNCDIGFPATIRRRALPAGTYFVIITAFGTGNATLNVQITDPTMPPSNTTCAAPTVIPPTGGHFTGDFVEVPDTYRTGCGFGGSPDLVYELTIPAESDVTINAASATGESLDWELRPTCDSMTGAVHCAYGSPAVATEHQLPAGTYYLILEGPTSSAVNFTLDVTVGPPTPRVRGDLCGDAIPLTAGTPYMGTMAGAEDDYDTTCGYHYNDLVHTFTLAAASDVTLDVNAGSAYMNASIRSACTDGSSQVRCVSGGPLHARVRDLAAGTYYVVLEAPRAGNYTANLTVTTPPAVPTPATGNDACGGAIVIPAATGGYWSGTTVGMLDDYQTSTCGNMAQSPDVAFRLDLPRRSQVTASTEGSSFDTVLYMFTGSCRTRMETACNDDGGGMVTSLLSQTLDPGTYFFIVDGWGTSATGTYEFEVQITPM
jgi:hypothetical protein